MAMARATVRWCKARLCTGFLLIVFCAVAWFAISASYHSLHTDPISNSDNEYESGLLQMAADRHLFGGTDNDDGSEQNYDDDVQICKYPLVTAKETSDGWDAEHELETCTSHPENLFYLDNGFLMTYKNVLEDKRLDRCEISGIVWKSDSEFDYTNLQVRRTPASFEVQFEHDFVHVQCYLEHQDDGQTTGSVRRKDEVLGEVHLNDASDSLVRSRRDEHEANKVKDKNTKKKAIVEKNNGSETRPRFQFHDVKDFHRSVVHRNAPRLVGSLGLPDFRDNFVGQSSKTDSNENKNKDSRHLLSQSDSYDQAAQEVDHREHIAADDQSPKQNDDVGVDNPSEGKAPEEGPSVDPSVPPLPTDRRQSTQPSIDQFLVQVSEKPEVLDRVTKEVHPLPTSLQMNVLLLAIDSISRSSFEKNFRSSSQFLKEELKAVVMNGYNSIGDAATAAVIPLITGFKEEEVREIGRSGHAGRYVDLLSFIWNKFEQSGYVTLYAEDQPRLGTFQAHYHGFEIPPVDHYMRPFWLAASESSLDATSQPNCLGSVPKHQYTLDYLADFFRKYKSVPKFAFGFLSEFNKSQVVDDDLLSFLKLLKKEKHLENTLLVILGDHGKSYGPLRSTIAGKLEESLPYLSLAFPAGFKTRYSRLMANLKTNRNRLTTAFDVHKTMMTLLDINSTQMPVNLTSRAISLLQEVPRQRTCMSAEVDVHWCTCVKFEQVNDPETVEKTGRSLASMAVHEINKMLDRGDTDKQCARLSIQSVQYLRVVFTNEIVLDLTDKLDAGQSEVFNISGSFPLFARYHQVVFRTTPSDALFEATVVYSAASPSGSIIDGQISRINAYGRQSDCIFKTHPDLRKFCQCSNA